MFNKVYLLLLVPGHMHSMDVAHGSAVTTRQNGFNHGQDGLTMPLKGTVYQEHTFDIEDVEGSGDEEVFLSIISNAEKQRRAIAEEKKRLAALALKQQEKKQRRGLEGLFVEGDNSSGEEMVFPDEYGGPLVVFPKRPPTEFEQALDKDMRELGRQISEIWDWIIG